MLLLQESFFSLTSHPAWWNFWGISSHPLRPQDLSAPSPSELLELWYCEHFQREIFFFCGIFVSKMTFAHFPTERVEIKCQRIQWWPRATSPRAGQPSISHPSKSLPFFLLFVTLFESQVPTGSQNTVPWCPFFDVKKRSHCGAKGAANCFFPFGPSQFRPFECVHFVSPTEASTIAKRKVLRCRTVTFPTSSVLAGPGRSRMTTHVPSQYKCKFCSNHE